MNIRKYWFGTPLALLLAWACMSTSPSPPPERRDPSTGEPALEGSRYESMRVVARRLADSAAAVRDAAASRRGRRGGEETLDRMSELVTRARDLHWRLDNYSNPPRYVQREVRELDTLVRDIDSRLRYEWGAGAPESRWREVLDLMDRMNRLAAGEDVLPPAADTGSGPVFPTPTYEDRPGTGEVLQGRALDDFRRLARELAVRATLASEAAERSGARDATSDRLLRDVQDFRGRARDLERRSDATRLGRSDLRQDVDRLHDEARRIDRELRDRGLYTGIWNDWTEVLLLLRRMAEVVRGDAPSA